MKNNQFTQNIDVDGVTYHYRRVNNLVTDIEIPDTVTEFWFRCFSGNTIGYLLRNVPRQFPQVHTLVIEDNVSLIELRNSMFPNVRIVRSHGNKFFTDNVPCLICQGILQNVFCLGADDSVITPRLGAEVVTRLKMNLRSPSPSLEEADKRSRQAECNVAGRSPVDGVLDGSSVQTIADYALEGCRSTQLTNLNQPNLRLHSMDGLIDDSTFSKDHTKLLGGSVLFGIEPDMDIRLPEHTFKIAPNCKILSAKGYIVPNIRAFLDALCGMHSTAFENKEGKMFPFYFPKQAFRHLMPPITLSRLFGILRPSHIEMEENEFYCVDGDVVYTKDKKTIVSVLPSVTEFSIPDTVKTIASFSFQNCKQLASITIPDSVTWIGDHAFSSDSLTSLTFESTHHVHMDCHSFALSQLQELYLPGGLSDVPRFASPLGIKKLVLGEGIVSLGEIYTPGIQELYLPASLQALERCSFSSVKTVYLAGMSFPNGLFNSLSVNTANTGSVPLEDTLIRLVMQQLDGSKHVYYIPRAISYDYAKGFDDMFACGLSALVKETNGFTGLFQMCQSTQQMQDTAVQLSFLGVDKEASAFVKKAGSAIVKRFIKTDYSEANFLTLVRTGLLSKNALQTVCHYAQQSQYTSLLAYTLEQLKHSASAQKRAFVL